MKNESVFSPTFGKLPAKIVGRDTEINNFLSGLSG
jgi:hypothetical protein